jgi:hypothetical protein
MFVRHTIAGSMPGAIIELLDRVLIVRNVAPLSTLPGLLREHTLVPETPFL